MEPPATFSQNGLHSGEDPSTRSLRSLGRDDRGGGGACRDDGGRVGRDDEGVGQVGMTKETERVGVLVPSATAGRGR